MNCLFKVLRAEASCKEKWSGYLRDQGPVKGLTGSAASLIQQDVICRALQCLFDILSCFYGKGFDDLVSGAFLDPSDVVIIFLSVELRDLDGSVKKQFLYPFRGSVYKNTYRDNVRVQVCDKSSYLITCDISGAFGKFYDKSALVWFCLVYIRNVFRAFQTADFNFCSLLLFFIHINSSTDDTQIESFQPF